MSSLEKTIVRLHPTRGMRFRLSLNHTFAGLLLLATGIGGLGEEGRHILPWAEILVGAAVLTAIALELRKPEGAAHKGVRWVEILAGIMLFVEGLHARRPGGIFQPALFYGIAGLVSIAIGTNAIRVSRMRTLVLDDAGFSIRTTPFRRLELAWKEIASYEALPDGLHVTTRDGERHTVRLRMVANRGEVTRTFAEYAVRRVRGSSKKG